MSDPCAKNIAKDFILANETKVKARRTLYNQVMDALPAKKALRHLQLERRRFAPCMPMTSRRRFRSSNRPRGRMIDFAFSHEPH